MKLPDRVVHGIRRRFHQEGWSGALTLQRLAAEFNVSLTPVRQAVDSMVRGGEIIRLPNGRLKLGKVRRTQVASDPGPTPESLLKLWVVERVLLGSAPQFLREEEMGRRFGLGRTVLRRVFARLSGEGLLEHVERRGWRLTPVSDADIEGYIEVRILLETAALRSAWSRLDLDRLRSIRDANAAGVLDNSLHAEWISQCGNRSLQSFFEREAPLYSTLFQLSTADPKATQIMAGQHVQIIEAILNGDQELACRALAEHISIHRNSVAGLREMFRGRWVKVG